MNIGMIGKSLMKQHYLKQIYSNLSMEDITEVDYKHGKSL